MVVRGILFAFLAALVWSQTPEQAAAALSKSIAAHLAPDEVARLTVRNLSSLPQPAVAPSEAAIERALRKRIRNPVGVDVTLTFSENTQGYLMIAEIRHENDRAVEMEAFQMQPAAAPPRAGISIEKRSIWEQDSPILDIAAINDQMLVLDTSGIGRYQRRDGKWTRTQFFDLATTVRDPRGRLEISGSAITASVPGETCRGAWDPQLSLTCESGGMFTTARNTMESTSWAPFYSQAQSGDTFLLAETDGRTHIYDAARKPAGSFRDWGSDFAAAPAGCPGLLVSGPGDRNAADFVALYEVRNGAPVRLSDPAPLPGPITALWPGVAIVRNLSTERYEAYSLTLDCSR